MLFATLGQAYIFLATVYGGLSMGLFRDVLDLVGRLCGNGKLVRLILDLLFWLVIAFIGFYVAFLINDGAVRPYMFLGFATGFVLYRLSLRRVVVWVFGGLEAGLRAIARGLISTQLWQKLFR